MLKAARLKHADAGSISIDGQDAAQSRARSWWREVTVVSPHMSLIRAKIVDNVLLGANSPADEGERRRILRAFGLNGGKESMAVGENVSPEWRAWRSPVRAARAVLRHSALVLVADTELFTDDGLFDVFPGRVGKIWRNGHRCRRAAAAMAGTFQAHRCRVEGCRLDPTPSALAAIPNLIAVAISAWLLRLLETGVRLRRPRSDRRRALPARTPAHSRSCSVRPPR